MSTGEDESTEPGDEEPSAEDAGDPVEPDDTPATDAAETPADEEEAAPPAKTLDDYLTTVESLVHPEDEDAEQADIESAFEELTEALEVATTEADLDKIEDLLDDIESVIESLDLPEPDDEDAEDPRAELESHLADTQSALEEHRGPYAEDLIETTSTASTKIEETRWTEQGETEIVDAVNTFIESVTTTLDVNIDQPDDPDALTNALSSANEHIDDAALDPDDDAELISTLAEATDQLTQALEDAQEWDDLTTREQLQALGFYDVIDHHKDYPPEWSALKEHEQRGNIDMVLLAFEKLGMEFMERHCFEALKRMADPAATETMLELAERRNKDAIEVLGKIGTEDAIDTIIDYVDTDSDPQLQKITLKALGEIGSPEATQRVANKLASDNAIIRSYAARSLGMIGDTRAVDPLIDSLENDESNTVRGSAAWGLNQIGTQDALEAVSVYADDRAYLVQIEAEKAATAMNNASA